MCWDGCNYCGKAVKTHSCGCKSMYLQICSKCRDRKRFSKSRCQVCGSKDVELRKWITMPNSKNYLNKRICEGLRFSYFKSDFAPYQMKKIREIRCFDCQDVTYSGFEGSFHYITKEDYL